MPKTQSRAGDFTGRERDRLAKEKADEIAARAAELSMMQAAQPTLEDTVDLQPKPKEEPKVEVETLEVEIVEDRVMEFRVNESLENVTIGYGNTYDFVEGQRYRAPKSIYDYLDKKGFVWH